MSLTNCGPLSWLVTRIFQTEQSTTRPGHYFSLSFLNVNKPLWKLLAINNIYSCCFVFETWTFSTTRFYCVPARTFLGVQLYLPFTVPDRFMIVSERLQIKTVLKLSETLMLNMINGSKRLQNHGSKTKESLYL